ncbi:protein of unknown function [Candidatus Filomicrobium marinum]|uniref:Uncharacterized protein n=1 Tax=Candidatus Filomicrobium marinum TaxID=1608628 RepID=A0A0D6JL77_9HYPH|nr:protein of unknown function [Candidatus Filomicrobium marinum]CPR22427.1 protein of unknown function [Candidatus Filomicrobium marinum]
MVSGPFRSEALGIGSITAGDYMGTPPLWDRLHDRMVRGDSKWHWGPKVKALGDSQANAIFSGRLWELGRRDAIGGKTNTAERSRFSRWTYGYCAWGVWPPFFDVRAWARRIWRL